MYLCSNQPFLAAFHIGRSLLKSGMTTNDQHLEMPGKYSHINFGKFQEVSS